MESVKSDLIYAQIEKKVDKITTC